MTLRKNKTTLQFPQCSRKKETRPNESNRAHWLVHRDRDRSRGYAVRYHHQGTRSRFHAGWHTEMSRDDSGSGRNSHPTVIARPGVEDVPSRIVGDPHQGIVGGRLLIVTVSAALREAVELC